jgi:tRNA G18 (ribose-2'-O)-methylase SpoU
MPAHDRKLSMDELGRATPEAMARLPRHRLRLVLDDLRSRHNVGSLFRTADAFALEGISLCGQTPVPPHREIEKTALGATRTVPWVHETDVLAAVERLKASGYTVLAVEQTLHARDIATYQPPAGRPLALVLGNELNGVADRVVEACDACLVLPQHGAKHSLNVAVCGGIAVWWLAGRHPPPGPTAPFPPHTA